MVSGLATILLRKELEWEKLSCFTVDFRCRYNNILFDVIEQKDTVYV